MAICVKPDSSRARLIAATRPSIMSEGDDVGARPREGDSRAREEIQRRIVGDLPGLDDPAVAVIGVLAEADIGDEEDPGDLLLQLAEGPLDDSRGVEGTGARRVLRGGDAEENHARDPVVPSRLDLLDEGVDG